MSTEKPLPENWDLEGEETAFDPRMERDYTRITYVDSSGTKLRISTVQEYGKLDGWGYHVWTDDPGTGSLGLVESLEDAKEIACDYMKTTAETAPA
jgi:hypothetical protein